MQIYWFTGRSLNDLCSTTQTSLASGLVEKGFKLTFVNSDEKGSHDDWPWLHQSITTTAPIGLRSYSLAKQMCTWFAQQEMEQDCIALVDWKIANKLIKLFKQRNIRWILIDRSPPADKGIYSFLQWPVWRRSWKKVRAEKTGKGCVVSEMHRQFVHKKLRVNQNSITVLPAGVDLNRFKIGTRYEKLTMVYHGRLDRHRGVLSLPMLLQKATKSGLEIQLVLVGEGDCFKGLQAIAVSNENITVHPTLPQEELAEILSKCHVGLLPMPKQKVWAIASPLKRSEYAASGLLMFGIDHDGHRFSGEEDLNWMKLVHQTEFHDEGVKWLQSLEQSHIETLALQSRKYAEERLAWSHSVDALEASIVSLTAQDS